MKKIISTFIISLFFFNAEGQNSVDKIDGFTLCAQLGGNNFSNNKAADSALDEILNVIGASKRFVIQPCSNIDNAAAITLLGVRYIFYNPNWMSDLEYSGDWVNKFILAHEVGHHINNHTIDVALRISGQIKNSQDLASSRFEELEADEFAGFVLGRLGANLNQALSAVQNLSNSDDTYSTHPKRDKRINAVKKGFKNSGGKINSSNIGVAKGKTVDSPYSNSRYAGVKYQTRNDLFSDGIYVGYISVNTDKPFGYGTFRGNNGYKYEGEWSDGKNGYGKETWPDGSYREGFYVNDYFSGKGVEYNGSEKIVGNFSKGKKTGKCITNLEGFSIEGTYNNDYPIKGELTNTKTNEKIKFGFLDDIDGTGYNITFTNFDGSKITGNFFNGALLPSRGLEYGFDGMKSFLTNKEERMLKRKELEANINKFLPSNYFPERYIGGYRWKFDISKYIGHKIWKLNTGEFEIIKRIETRYSNSDDYEKEYMDYKNNESSYPYYIGDALSLVKIEYEGGIIYEGYIVIGGTNSITVDDIATGYGEVIYPNDDERLSYKGIFLNDKKNGFGILKYKNGKTQKGIFKEGKFVKSENFDFDYLKFSMKPK